MKDFYYVLQKALEIENPSKHKDPLQPVQQFRSSGESFGTNVVHVSRYQGQDSGLFFISEHDDSLPSSSPGQLYFKTRSMPAATVPENPMFNMQENNVANAMPSAMMNQTPSQSSYVLPAYCCVSLSQQPQSTQFFRGNDGLLRHDCS